MKKKANTETTFPATAPIRTVQLSARVELTPPTSDGAETQEKVTQDNIVDIQRYLRWADKAITPRSAKKRDRRGHVPPKAA